ncbi:hypothetical protein IMG5_139640 [Ichthyophthirius multifiliis]|uniref:Uncharacterized protein n=1 Tax=Ichthyophthirius multifiliis TaxID=5932 RepID=G0QX89_ICHMU|nr:hypothetical protein IMG5_139640 [Ichthyophthirius multifiliis]EGR30161.1 hypothetical protein IMG5_139640 [Ichthyophthirius multifiliis]|eukprot:XP_004031397.1 hypothetical protein IMG5_139640 [Ichthyophthirius multifiliis]
MNTQPDSSPQNQQQKPLNTRQQALKDFQNLIEENKTKEGLRVFFSSLNEYKKPQNYTSNESEVFLIGLICDIYGTQLIDPLDNDLISSCLRVAQLISKYFRDTNESVQKQCCKTWKQIYRSQLLNESVNNKLAVLYEIPSGIICGGTDRFAQITSVMIIEAVLELAEKIKDREFLILVYFLNSEKNYNYNTKVASLELITLIGIQILEQQIQIIGQYHNYISKQQDNQVTKTIIVEDDLGIKNILNKQGAYVNDLKAKQYIKKYTGYGGGRIDLDEQKLRIQKNKSKERQQLIRNYILNKYKDLRQQVMTYTF